MTASAPNTAYPAASPAKRSGCSSRWAWSRPAAELDRIVRVGDAWTTFRSRRLKVLAAEPVAGDDGREPGAIDGGVVATGEGGLRLLTVQPAGKPAMAWSAFANGARSGADDRLGR